MSDLLLLLLLPEWPAAGVLLRRFVNMLRKEQGLCHTETYVRLLSIDFLGQVRHWSRMVDQTELAVFRLGVETETQVQGSIKEKVGDSCSLGCQNRRRFKLSAGKIAESINDGQEVTNASGFIK